MEPLLTSIYFLGALAGLVGAIADGFLNQWAKNGGTGWLSAGYIGSLIMVTIFVYMLKREALGMSLLIFVLSNALCGLFISRVFFGERLAPVQWIGVAFAVFALVLLDKGK